MTDSFAAGLVATTMAAIAVSVVAVGTALRERWRRIDAEVEQAKVRAQVQAELAAVKNAMRRRLALDDGFERLYRPSRN